MVDWKESAKFVAGELGAAAKGAGKLTQNAVRAMTAPTHVCSQCGFAGKPIMKSKQNGCFALILLLCFVIPGILYILFTSKTYPVCPKCNTWNTMIPIDAPRAQALRHTEESVRHERPCPYCAEPILVQARVCKHCGREVA
ncbi:MAG: hypothetical protein JWM95_50 [Gemmatimonadetes bacterium]|nr:hypothetical protein [Gemmatimonadota bacterium]